MKIVSNNAWHLVSAQWMIVAIGSSGSLFWDSGFGGSQFLCYFLFSIVDIGS